MAFIPFSFINTNRLRQLLCWVNWVNEENYLDKRISKIFIYNYLFPQAETQSSFQNKFSSASELDVTLQGTSEY